MGADPTQYKAVIGVIIRAIYSYNINIIQLLLSAGQEPRHKGMYDLSSGLNSLKGTDIGIIGMIPRISY